jgi:hypothetical protein
MRSFLPLALKPWCDQVLLRSREFFLRCRRLLVVDTVDTTDLASSSQLNSPNELSIARELMHQESATETESSISDSFRQSPAGNVPMKVSSNSVWSNRLSDGGGGAGGREREGGGGVLSGVIALVGGEASFLLLLVVMVVLFSLLD